MYLEESMKYEDYLNSKQWKHIRRNVLRRDKWTCASCGGYASQVHHLQYDPATMRGERLNLLMSLCAGCHEAVSLDVTGCRRDKGIVIQWSLEALAAERAEPKQPRPQRQARRKKLDMAGIRALSQQYAEGRME